MPLSCEIVETGGFWAAIFRGGGGGIPKISNMHFQTALTSEHVAGFG